MANTKLIQFSADWCSVCKSMKPIVTSVVEELGVDFEYVDVDTEEGRHLAVAYSVQSLPTFIVIDGDERREFWGGRSKLEFTELVAGPEYGD